jgi:hypothetical protein
MNPRKLALEIKNVDRHFNKKIANKDIVNLIVQYYPAKGKRLKENLFCLYKNVHNPYIDKIYLLNEKIYTAEELGFAEMPEKIEQVNVGKRLKFKDVFEFARDREIKGYIIISNLDIYFNKSLRNIYYTSLKTTRSAYCQLRYEFYLKMRIKWSMKRSWSQDTWIYHSSHPVKDIKKFNYFFGQPGCDIRTNFLLLNQGFRCYNHPKVIQCIHVHYGIQRNYRFGHTKGVHAKVVPIYNIKK